VFHHYGGVALNGVEIAFLKGVAGFRGRKHLARQDDGAVRVLVGYGLFGGEGFVQADDKFGKIVQPGELLVVDDQAEEFAGGDMAVGMLVIAALHVQEGFVQAQERDAESHELLPRGILRSAIVDGIEVGGAHRWRTERRTKFIVRHNGEDFQRIGGRIKL
jgi:hypothetical protein